MSNMLSEADRERIKSKIGEIEARTAGEIVVHVVGRSSGYGFLRAVYAATGAYVVAQVAVLMEPLADRGLYLADWALPAMPVLVFLLWLALGVPAVLRRVLPAGLVAEAVHRRAETAFLENRVHRTIDASGVLVLVSELEHRVEILADEGIHARVGVEGWKKHVDQLVKEIRAGRATEGLLGAIDRIGEELAAGFPPRSDDTNELPDQVVTSSR